MPAVKCLHQESEDNSKSEYIMGHSFQVLSLLVKYVGNQVFALPLISRISEGGYLEESEESKNLIGQTRHHVHRSRSNS